MATLKYFKAKATTSRLSTRGSPSPDKDMETRGSPPRGEGDHNTVDMDNLFAEVTKMSTMLQEAEGRIHHLENATEGLINNRDRHEKRMDAMWNHLQMLENHSKRNNVRLVGLKETLGRTAQWRAV